MKNVLGQRADAVDAAHQRDVGRAYGKIETISDAEPHQRGGASDGGGNARELTHVPPKLMPDQRRDEKKPKRHHGPHAQHRDGDGESDE